MALLLIDIGRGTQDILLYRAGEAWENCVQLVLPAPTLLLAGAVERASARGDDILFTGETMGGGPLTTAAREHVARGGRAWATPLAAATFDDDPAAVEAMGIRVVGDDEGPALAARRGVSTVRTGDLDLDALERTLEAWGIDRPVDAAAVAVQDHGRAPEGMSDREFRFARFRELLGRNGNLSAQAYGTDDLPGCMTRMGGARRALEGRRPLLFMDTGFAALLGAMEDPQVGRGGTKLLLNVGNGHLLAGLVEGESVLGLLEHHTLRLDGGSLQEWLDSLVNGKVLDEQVRDAGGHGAYLREGSPFPGWEGVEVFAATGPRRGLAATMRPEPRFAAPHGQMMLTGAFGLYRAFEARWGPYEG